MTTQLLQNAEPSNNGDQIAPDSAEFFSNYVLVEKVKRGANGEVELERAGLNAAAIRRNLCNRTDDWPRRVNGVLFVPDGDRGPLWLPRVNDLFGWLQSKYGNGDANSVQWVERGTGFVTRSEIDAYLRQNATQYEAVESAPHWPELKGHYYLHPKIPTHCTGKFDELLRWFTPATPDDGLLIASFVLTCFWGGPYGMRPGFLFTGTDDDIGMGRGVGKTTLIRMGGRLVGGTFDIRPGDKWENIQARLLSNTESATQRIIHIDNVKSHRFSWSDVEALITSESINGKRLYYGDGRRPNVFTVTVTLNGASLSKDLAQRFVIIKLKRPSYSGNWESDLAAFIDRHRWEIVGDIIEHLKRPARQLNAFSRWGIWERDILGRLPNPEGLQKLIQERREEVDDDSEEARLIRDAIADEIRERGHGEPECAGVRIPASIITELMSKALGEKLTTTAAGTKLKAIAGAIPELRKAKYCGRKVWVWHGEKHAGNAEDLCSRRCIG